MAGLKHKWQHEGRNRLCDSQLRRMAILAFHIWRACHQKIWYNYWWENWRMHNWSLLVKDLCLWHSKREQVTNTSNSGSEELHLKASLWICVEFEKCVKIGKFEIMENMATRRHK